MNILGHKMRDVFALRAKPTDGWPDGRMELFFANSAYENDKINLESYCFICVFLTRQFSFHQYCDVLTYRVTHWQHHFRSLIGSISTAIQGNCK